MAGQSKRKADAHACVKPTSSHIGKAITVWYIEGEDDVKEVEYKVWIVDFLRHQSQIAVEDDDGRWEVEVDFFDDDWAWGHDQDRHASFRVPSQGLRDSRPTSSLVTRRSGLSRIKARKAMRRAT